MSGTEYTVIAYVIGLGLILGYAGLLCLEARAMGRRQRRTEDGQ